MYSAFLKQPDNQKFANPSLPASVARILLWLLFVLLFSEDLVVVHDRPSGIQSNSISGLKGAYWHKRKSKWQSTISFEGKALHLGYFDSGFKLLPFTTGLLASCTASLRTRTSWCSHERLH
jgi:hypothetical protein